MSGVTSVSNTPATAAYPPISPASHEPRAATRVAPPSEHGLPDRIWLSKSERLGRARQGRSTLGDLRPKPRAVNVTSAKPHVSAKPVVDVPKPDHLTPGKRPARPASPHVPPPTSVEWHDLRNPEGSITLREAIYGRSVEKITRLSDNRLMDRDSQHVAAMLDLGYDHFVIRSWGYPHFVLYTRCLGAQCPHPVHSARADALALPAAPERECATTTKKSKKGRGKHGGSRLGRGRR